MFFFTALAHKAHAACSGKMGSFDLWTVINGTFPELINLGVQEIHLKFTRNAHHPHEIGLFWGYFTEMIAVHRKVV